MEDAESGRQMSTTVMRSRLISIWLIGCALIPFLAGCGNARFAQGDAASPATVVATPSPTAAAPALLSLPAVAYDGVSHRLLVFGGAQHNGQFGALSDTWTLGDTGWSRAGVQAGPSARFGALATYDPIRRNVVLFGGQGNSHQLLTDTWIWNGSLWASQAPSRAPHWLFPLAGNLTFDFGRGEVLLFGNTGTSFSPTKGPDSFTWAWTGSDWVRKDTVSPPFRFGAAMAYDGLSQRVVIFGGYQFEGPEGRLGDTWIWDGAVWKQAPPSSSPPPPGIAYAAYDEKANRLWLLTIDGGMWYWSTNTWQRQGTFAAVAYRINAAMVFHADLGKIVLYGGTQATQSSSAEWIETHKSDLWSWDGTTWSQLA